MGTSQEALVAKNPAANAGDIRDVGSVPESAGSPGGGHGNPLQSSCLEGSSPQGRKELDTTEATEHTHAQLTCCELTWEMLPGIGLFWRMTGFQKTGGQGVTTEHQRRDERKRHNLKQGQSDKWGTLIIRNPWPWRVSCRQDGWTDWRCYLTWKKKNQQRAGGTFLVAQGLRHHAPKAGGLGSIPDQGTRSH